MAGQLTELDWRCEISGQRSVPSVLTSPAVLCKLGKLQRLDVPTLDDAGLRVLLAHMPVLTHVRVWKVQLQDSHVDVGCSLEELTVRTVSVTSLAHLPLWGIKRVCAGELVSTSATNDNGATAAAAAAAAAASHTAAAAKLAAAMAAAPHCTFACWEPETRSCGDLKLKCCVAEMPLLLPLLARWQDVDDLRVETPSGEQLTPAAVAALGALLEGMPSCTGINIDGPIPHPSALLLQALARSNVSKVFLEHEGMTDVHLLLWCSGGQASKPITVTLLDGCDFVGNISRVRSAVDVPDSGVVLEGDVIDDGGN
jgi:hypothetical protein